MSKPKADETMTIRDALLYLADAVEGQKRATTEVVRCFRVFVDTANARFDEMDAKAKAKAKDTPS